MITQKEFQNNFVNNFQTLYYQYYRKKNSWKEKKNNALKYLSFIHKPELRFHYRFLSVQHRTKKWSFENLPPCDLVYDFLSRSFRFFSHFWIVVWLLWRFNLALIRPTCNSAAKHQLYIEFEILARDGMNVQLRRVSPSWRARAPAIVLSSYQIEVTLANHFKRLQLTSSAYLKVGMSLIEHRYIATAFGNMLDFGLYTQHRSSCHEAYRAAYFQKIHSLCNI